MKRLMESLAYRNIHVKLLLVLVIIFLPAAVMVVASGLGHRGHAIETARESALLLVQSLAAQQEKISSGTRLMLSTLAQLPEVKSLDPEACNKIFRDLSDQHPAYSVISAVTPDGNMFAASVPFQHNSINLSDRKHIIDVINTLDFSVGEYIVLRTRGAGSINYTYPVFDSSNRLTAIVGAGFALNEYASFIEQIKLPEGSALTITDHRGIRLYRYPESEAAPPGAPLPEDGLQVVLGGAEQGLVERTGMDGVYRIYAFKQLRLRDNVPPYLCMLVGIPMEPIVRMANREMFNTLFLLGLLWMLSMALAWSFGQYVLARPIERLLVATHRLASGNLGARTELNHGSDELGRLAKSFDDMAALLQRRSQEREEAEERLRKSEEKYRHIVEHSMEGIFQSTPDGRYLTVNPAFAEMFGFESPQQMVSEVRNIGEQLYRHPADRQNILERIHAEGRLLGLEAEVLKRSGEPFWMSLSATCARDPDGNVLYYDGFVADITERKRTEAALLDRERALRRAYAFSHSLLKNVSEGLCVCHEGPESPFMQFTIWNDRMVEITGFTRGEINSRGWEQCLIADPESRARASERLSQVYLGEDLQDVEGTIIRADGSERAISISTSVVESDDGRLHILTLVRDISDWKRAQEELLRHREHLEDLVQARTGDLEAAIEQLNEEVLQRRSVETTLRESEEKLRSFIETTSDWVWEIDRDGRFTYVSDKITAVLGYDPDEVLGAHPWDFMPPEVAKRSSVEYPLYASRAKPFLHIENPHIHKDGRFVDLETSSAPLFDSSGAFVGYRGTNRDISKRKAIEAQLRESEAKYRTLVEQIPAITYIIALGEQFNTVYVSPQVEPMLGFTQEQAIHDRKLKSRIVHPDDRERLLAQLRQLRRDGGPFCEEYRLFDAHGAMKWIRDEARVVRDGSGNPIFLHGVMLDISDRKHMEEALRYSENLYRTVFENTGTGMILIEEDTTISLVNARYESWLGHCKGDVQGKRSWTDFVLQRDLERLKTYHSLRRESPELAPSQYEVQAIDGKGRIRDLLTTVSMIPGTRKSVASLQDITERKETERALHQLVAELHNLQCITQKLLQLEELPSVMHAIAEGIVVNIGYDVALAARYDATELALTGFVIYPPSLETIMDQYLGGSPKGTLWDRKLRCAPGQNPILDRVLKGEMHIGDSLGPFISLWLSAPKAREIQERTGRKGYVLLPMQVKGETVGVILTGWNANGHDLNRMRSALGRVADQAAVAVKSAGLFECVKTQSAELRGLAAKLQNLQETERKVLAQELHDRVGQNLTGLSINLGLIRSTLSPVCLEQVQLRIADCVGLVGSTMECVRDVMAELHPPGLSEYGLTTALKLYCEQLSKRTGMRLSVKSTEAGARPDRECEGALFRIAQEALTNAIRHSQAREVTVSLKPVGKCLTLCVADDGIGLDTSTGHTLAEGGKFGLITMRERAEAVGGEFRVESTPGKGTRVVVVLKRVMS